MAKQIIIDLEFTKADIESGRIYEVCLMEFEDFKPTGRKFSSLVNPEKPLVNMADFTHQVTDEELADQPIFKDIAQEVKDFIGDDTIYITCRTVLPTGTAEEYFFTGTLENMDPPEGCFTGDIDLLNKEMETAGLSPFPAEQWFNARRMFEVVMDGQDEGSLSKALAHCGLTKEDFGTAHRADADVLMLAAVLPQMLKEYEEKRAEYEKQKV